MIVEPERQNRYRLFEYVAKPLDSFVEPDHILRRIEEAINFPKLATPLQAAYAADRGRPAIPLEVLLRALTLGFRSFSRKNKNRPISCLLSPLPNLHHYLRL
jgi:hypothetical protein